MYLEIWPKFVSSHFSKFELTLLKPLETQELEIMTCHSSVFSNQLCSNR